MLSRIAGKGMAACNLGGLKTLAKLAFSLPIS